jgi:hypothetical protein
VTSQRCIALIQRPVWKSSYRLLRISEVITSRPLRHLLVHQALTMLRQLAGTPRPLLEASRPGLPSVLHHLLCAASLSHEDQALHRRYLHFGLDLAIDDPFARSHAHY